MTIFKEIGNTIKNPRSMFFYKQQFINATASGFKKIDQKKYFINRHSIKSNYVKHLGHKWFNDFKYKIPYGITSPSQLIKREGKKSFVMEPVKQISRKDLKSLINLFPIKNMAALFVTGSLGSYQIPANTGDFAGSQQINNDFPKASQKVTLQKHKSPQKKFIEVAPESRVLYKTSPNNKFCKVTLNNPKTLNALDINMIQSQQKKVKEWEKNKSQVVVFKGAGCKSFCSGGDIKKIYQITKGLIQEPLIKNASDFIYKEYEIDSKLAEMKPMQISLWDGYVMGGGVGISIHAPIVIATEKTVFAMPECKIGLFCDVGAGFFLSRVRNSIGMYLGLTSSVLRGEDVVKVGLAKYFVESKDLPELEEKIERLVSENPDKLIDQEIQKKIYEFVEKYDKKVKGPIANENLINKIFSLDSFEKIYDELKKNTENKEFTKKALELINSNNPLSVKVVFEQLTRQKNVTLKEALISDYRTAYKFFNEGDFFEGVRCLLVDKGEKPKWKYNSFEKITKEIVDSYFQEIPNGKELEI